MVVVGDDQALAADREPTRVGEQTGGDDLGRAAAVEVEALHAVVEAVGDEDEAASDCETAACRRVVAAAGAEVKLPDAAAAAAERADQVAGGVEAVDPVVAAGNEQRVVRRDRDGADRRELAGSRAGEADLAPERPVRPEDLYDARRLIGHVDRPVGSDRDRLRKAQHAAAALADLRGRRVRAGCRRAGARSVSRGDIRRGERGEREHAGRDAPDPAVAPAGHRHFNHGGRR